MPVTTSATINLAAIRHNLSQVKKLAPNSKIMAVIKADAYGHGIVDVAMALKKADGLAVARLEEAQQLRAAGMQQPILLLCAPLDADGFQDCSRQNIDIVIHDRHSLDMLLTTSLSKPVTVWVKHDSGMHRLGLSSQQLKQAMPKIIKTVNANKIVLMTHFSSSEQSKTQMTEQQIHRFFSAGSVYNLPQSLANSAAIIQHPASHKDWVRPGIMLYGANPLDAELARNHPVDLKPVMTLTTTVIAIRHIKKGESVGYNSRWTAAKDSIIATLGAGYGDGYPRHAGNGTPVLINGQRALLVGTVSMDLITVDISYLSSVNVGDKAILWGEGLAVEEIADHAKTISYQLFTGVTKRVPRIFING